MSKEYSIILASNIFQVVTDSMVPDVVKIKLLAPDHEFRCANFLIGWTMFLGQMIKMPSGRNFRFVEIQEIVKEFELPFFTRYWDIFSRRKNYNKVAGLALQQSYISK